MSARDELSALRALLVHPGYKWLEKQLLEHIALKTQQLHEPSGELVDVLRKEYIAGECKALSAIALLVNGQVNSLELQLKVKGQDDDDVD